MNMEMKNEIKDVPYVVHEATVERYERKESRNHLIILILIIGLIVSNCAWMYEWNQYEYVSSEVTIDSGSDGTAIYQDGKGNMINGESEEEN